MILKKADKEALERFQQLCERIANATADDGVFEESSDKEKRIDNLLGDYTAFVRYYFPHYATSECGDFHVRLARKAKKERRLRALLEWARGHAKSIHADVILPLFLKPQGELKVMLLVGKNYDAAETLLSDLQAELVSNRRYLRDFGDQMSFGSWEEGHFVTRDDCAFFALGMGQSPRGLRHRQFRPDYIVMDDCDDDKLSKNPKRVDEAYDWALEALIGAMDMGNGRFLVVGNKISKHSLVARFEENEAFWVSKVNALDKNGKPSWHQKYSVEDVEAYIKDVGYRRAQKELFNNPIQIGKVYPADWLRDRPAIQLRGYDKLIAYCDPSFKSTSTSDHKAIVLIGKRKDTTIDIIKVFDRQASVSSMVKWWYWLWQEKVKDNNCRHMIEANANQDTHLDEFKREGERVKKQLPIKKDMRAKPDKFGRIEAMSPLFENGMVYFNSAEKDDPDMKTLKEQFLAIEKGSSFPDDGPDAVEGGIYYINRGVGLATGTNRTFTPRQNRHF